MTAKNLDKQDRFRNITVGFRVSPEENELINKAVAMSGLSKQEYCYRKCTNQDVVVVGNTRVYKALRNELRDVLNKLQRIENGSKINLDLLSLIELITKTLSGLKGDDEYE